MLDKIKTYLLGIVVITCIGIIIHSLILKNENTKLSNDIETLTANYSKIEEAVKKQNADLISYKKDINNQYENIIILNNKTKEYATKIDNINTIISKHDLNAIADKKPNLLFKKINEAMKKEVKEINEIIKWWIMIY